MFNLSIRVFNTISAKLCILQWKFIMIKKYIEQFNILPFKYVQISNTFSVIVLNKSHFVDLYE